MKRSSFVAVGAVAGMIALASVLFLELGEWRRTAVSADPVQHLPDTVSDEPLSPVVSSGDTAFASPDIPGAQIQQQGSILDRLKAGDSELLAKYEFGDREVALAGIDLEALKERMPDNLYWEMGAPTQDEAVLESRRETRAFWREEGNRISANLADEYAIRDYYDYHHTLSEDYVAITDDLLGNYAAQLSQQDYQLLLLANRLHSTRLQEMPAKLASALKNRREFLARKDAWQEDPAGYKEALRKEREAALQELAAHAKGPAAAQ